MIKKEIYGKTLKEQYRASARDKLHRFLLDNGAFRGAVLHATRMINEMRVNHELGILETLVLGHAYIGAGLMTTHIKGSDRLSLQVECSGPVKGLLVEANAFGEVRGYLKNLPIPVERPLENFDLSPFLGAGIIKVTKYLEDAKGPFTGQVILKYGNLAKDLAYYFLTSEQIPTSFSLSIQFDKQGDVIGAGGLFLQVMPSADRETVGQVETLLSGFPSLGQSFADGVEPQKLICREFKDHAPKILDQYRVEFMCHCNEERVTNLLYMLPVDELKDIRDNGPFPLEIKCHHCNTPYYYNQADIRKIYGIRSPDN